MIVVRSIHHHFIVALVVIVNKNKNKNNNDNKVSDHEDLIPKILKNTGRFWGIPKKCHGPLVQVMLRQNMSFT